MLPFRLPLSELASLLAVLLGLGLSPGGGLRRLPPPPPCPPPPSSLRLDTSETDGDPLVLLALALALALLLLLRRRAAIALGSSFPSPLLDDGLSICAGRPRLFPAAPCRVLSLRGNAPRCDAALSSGSPRQAMSWPCCQGVCQVWVR